LSHELSIALFNTVLKVLAGAVAKYRISRTQKKYNNIKMNLPDRNSCYFIIINRNQHLVNRMCILFWFIIIRVGFLPRQKVFLPGQWKKPVKTTVKTGKNWQ